MKKVLTGNIFKCYYVNYYTSWKVYNEKSLNSE